MFTENYSELASLKTMLKSPLRPVDKSGSIMQARNCSVENKSFLCQKVLLLFLLMFLLMFSNEEKSVFSDKTLHNENLPVFSRKKTYTGPVFDGRESVKE